MTLVDAQIRTQKCPSEKSLSAPNIHVGTFLDRVALTRWKPKLKAGMLIFYLEFRRFLNFLDIFPSVSFNSNALENPTVVFKSFLGGREKFSRLQPGKLLRQWWLRCGSHQRSLACQDSWDLMIAVSLPCLLACLPGFPRTIHFQWISDPARFLFQDSDRLQRGGLVSGEFQVRVRENIASQVPGRGVCSRYWER